MLKTEKLANNSKKAIDLHRFYGIDRTKIEDGMLLDSHNVRVLDGGAVCSMLAEREIDVTVGNGSLEGVYTYSEWYDPSYETRTTAEWVYANICTADVLGYEDWQTGASRILVADIGKPAKTKGGYRDIIGAFSVGDDTFVFYTAAYNIIDERRETEYAKVGNGYTVQYDANDDGACTVYALSQVFLDVIDSGGEITTTLVDARLNMPQELAAKYKKSTMVSLDGDNFRYVTPDYAPALGASYKLYFDRVYTDIYPTLATDYPIVNINYGVQKTVVRYNNSENGDGEFAEKGEKLMLLPDMRLMKYSGGKWSLGAVNDTMPPLNAAVQHFERLYGICGDTLYVSCAGQCTNFTEGEDNQPITAGWRTVTSDSSGFTAITSFDGKVVVFTENSMMTVRGTELPFSLSYEGDFGCASGEMLATSGGSLYFISRDGVMMYSGNSVKNIGLPLGTGFDPSYAKLSATNGMVMLFSGNEGMIYYYDTESGQWISGMRAGEVCFAGTRMLVNSGSGYSLYIMFEEISDFSFAVAFKNRGRIRLRQISLTTEVGHESFLCLVDRQGRELMRIDSPPGEILTRNCLLPRSYSDHGEIFFYGSGDVRLYSMRVEYAPLNCSTRRIR